MRTSELDYYLPPELIAQHPVSPRDASRLLVFHRNENRLEHRFFHDLPDYLRPNDCLVLNETRVIPCRLIGQKTEGGARIEVLLLERRSERVWTALAYRSRRLRPGIRVRFADDFACEIREELGGGRFLIELLGKEPVDLLLDQYGQVPLPPYIERDAGSHPSDRERYQTVYARLAGSSAAPTAGLHFTPELLHRLEGQGVKTARVLLHVGLDTFQPILTEEVEAHPIHTEAYEVRPEAAETILQARQQGGRIIAVGTTSVRTLETVAGEHGILQAGTGRTSLFIRPGYRFHAVQALITNFHLPRTSLLALIAAFIGENRWRGIYEEAISRHYRFYSYGDAMLIL